MSVLASLIASKLSARMVEALLAPHPDDRLDGRQVSGTTCALIDRGLVEAGHGGRLLPLTDLGREVRSKLEARR